MCNHSLLTALVLCYSTFKNLVCSVIARPSEIFCADLAVVKPDIIETLVKKRDAELAEWREKRKKTAAENAAKEKPKEKEGAATSTESSLSAAPASTTTVSIPAEKQGRVPPCQPL